MKETRHYSGLLYALADTLTDPAQAEEVREAASRLDLQTVGLNEFRRQKEQAEKERDDWIDSHAKLYRKSSDRIAELERELETCRSDLEAATEACEELDGDLRAANQEWQPIETAPKDRRVLVRTRSGNAYAADWAQDPTTGDEAFLIGQIANPEGGNDQMIIRPDEWMDLPAAAQKQEGGGENENHP